MFLGAGLSGCFCHPGSTAASHGSGVSTRSESLRCAVHLRSQPQQFSGLKDIAVAELTGCSPGSAAEHAKASRDHDFSVATWFTSQVVRDFRSGSTTRNGSYQTCSLACWNDESVHGASRKVLTSHPVCVVVRSNVSVHMCVYMQKCPPATRSDRAQEHCAVLFQIPEAWLRA